VKKKPPSKNKPPALPQDDLVLWERYKTDVKKLEKEEKKPFSKQLKTLASIPSPLKEEVFQLEDTKPSSHSSLLYESRKKLKRPAVEASLDLHGFTQREAFETLGKFIKDSQQKGRQCVLVITGKGLRLDLETYTFKKGVLREELPRWLETEPLRKFVRYYTFAHIKDGGEGAFYIFLKRP
jgi:DNA-nicking Smr family endonuclease